MNFQRLVQVAELTAKSDRDQHIAANLPLVMMVGKKYCRERSITFTDELMSAAMAGLIRATDTFKPEYGFQFSTYASTCILNALKAERESARRFWSERQLIDETQELVIPVESHEDECDARMDSARLAALVFKVTPERDLSLVRHRMDGETLEEIGARLGVCKERVRQRLGKVFERVLRQRAKQQIAM